MKGSITVVGETEEPPADTECFAGAVFVEGGCSCPVSLIETPCKNIQGFCCTKPTDDLQTKPTEATTKAAQPADRDVWSEQDLADATVAAGELGADASCHYVLWEKEACTSPGGVYLISQSWYSGTM